HSADRAAQGIVAPEDAWSAEEPLLGLAPDVVRVVDRAVTCLDGAVNNLAEQGLGALGVAASERDPGEDLQRVDGLAGSMLGAEDLERAPDDAIGLVEVPEGEELLGEGVPSRGRLGVLLTKGPI